MFSFVNYNNLKFSIFFFISTFYILRLLFFAEPNLGGDLNEYALMIESFKNHYTPDLKSQDIDSCSAYIQKFYANSHHFQYLSDKFNGVRPVFSSNEFLSNYGGYFTALNGEKYSYHFFGYSTICLPARLMLGILNIDPLKTFMLTNFLIVLCVCFYTLFYSNLDETKRLALAGFFFFSGTLWYIPFPGPEVFSMSLLFLSLILFYEEKYFTSIFFIALASTQNPPIMLFSIVVFIKLIAGKGFSMKSVLIFASIGLICLIPGIFYFINFNIPNLIVHLGYLKNDNTNWTRFIGFFFDLNQGLFLSFPIIFFAFFFIYTSNLFFKNPREWKADLLFLPISLLIVFTFINMFIWNSSSNISRYATWSSIPFLVYALYHFNYKKRINQIFIITVFIFQVLFVYNYFDLLVDGEFNHTRFLKGDHNNLAKIALDNFPNLYNPDPDIFLNRTLHNWDYKPELSPVIYMNSKNEPKKLIVHYLKVDALPDSIKYSTKAKNINFINEWGYIDFE